MCTQAELDGAVKRENSKKKITGNNIFQTTIISKIREIYRLHVCKFMHRMLRLVTVYGRQGNTPEGTLLK